MTQVIPFAEADAMLDWLALTRALAEGHNLPKAEVDDVFLYQGDNTLLNRSAWIAGMGLAVKCATIFPGNRAVEKPVVGGAVNLFSDVDGALEAILDFHLVTKWKTAGDSLLAATRLARKDSRKILIVGAGTVGRALLQAYRAGFPDADFTIWNRTPAGAAAFQADHPEVTIADDLEAAVRAADIVSSATMSTEPLIKGDWLQPGQHVDLIHIGELKIPLASGAIAANDVIADYYALAAFERHSDAEITLFKNGGGAHLDLMTCKFIQQAWAAR